MSTYLPPYAQTDKELREMARRLGLPSDYFLTNEKGRRA